MLSLPIYIFDQNNRYYSILQVYKMQFMLMKKSTVTLHVALRPDTVLS